MKLMKRWSVLLAAGLCLSAVGCASPDAGGGSQAGSPAASPAGSASESAPASSSGGSAGSESDFSQHVTLTLTNVQTVEGWNYTDGDAYCKALSDKFNYDIEVTHVTNDTWAERMRIWITSGDMTDCSNYNFTYPEAVNYVDQGLLKRLPDGWKEKYPHLAELFEVSDLGPELEREFGGVYFVPRTRFRNKPSDPLTTHLMLYMRKDWAEAVGFPLKDAYTGSEIIEYGKLVAQQDPGGIGEKAVGLSFRPANAVLAFVQSNSTYYNTFYRDGDTYRWGPASEDTLRGLKVYQQAIQSGALDPEFYTLKDYEDFNKGRVSGVSGAWFGEGSPHAVHEHWEAYFRKNVGIPPEEAKHNAIILGEDGKFHEQELMNYWGTYIFNPKIDDIKLDRILSIMDYLATEEGYRTMCMGFEGVDWKYGPDGEYESLLGEGETLITKVGRYPGGGHTLFVPQFSDEFNLYQSPIYRKEHRLTAQNAYKLKEQYATPETLPRSDWDLFKFDSPNMRRVQFDYANEYTQLVTMEGDLETNWRNWIAQHASMIDPVIEELNAALIKQ